MAPTVEQLRDEVAGLDDVSLVERFRSIETDLRRLEAEMAVVTAEVDRRHVYLDDGHRSVAGWMRANANLAGRQIRPRLHLAALVDDLPEVIDRLADGHIGVAQAQQLGVVAANPRCGHLLGQSIEVLLEQAEQLSFDDAKRCLDRWVMFADLDGAHRDRAADHERRSADVVEIDGSLHVAASGGGALTAAELQAIFARYVDAEFRRDAAERLERFGPDAPTSLLPRTDAQRRFDALVAIFRASAASDVLGTPPQFMVNLLVDERTFHEGLAADGLVPQPAFDPDAPDWSGRRCETVDGTVVLPSDIVRAALHGYIRRVVVNTAGIPVDVGRRRRLFTGVARDVARLLGHHCDQPGCTVDASKCDIDHLAEWVRDGGLTDLDNAGLRCNSDNRSKRRLGLRVTRDARGRPHTQRADGTWMHPVGQRQLHLEAIPPPGANAPPFDDEPDDPLLDEAHLCRLARSRLAALTA
jgi:hypothetical protein